MAIISTINNRNIGNNFSDSNRESNAGDNDDDDYYESTTTPTYITSFSISASSTAITAA